MNIPSDGQCEVSAPVLSPKSLAANQAKRKAPGASSCQKQSARVKRVGLSRSRKCLCALDRRTSHENSSASLLSAVGFALLSLVAAPAQVNAAGATPKTRHSAKAKRIRSTCVSWVLSTRVGLGWRLRRLCSKGDLSVIQIVAEARSAGAGQRRFRDCTNTIGWCWMRRHFCRGASSSKKAAGGYAPQNHPRWKTVDLAITRPQGNSEPRWRCRRNRSIHWPRCFAAGDATPRR